MSVPKNIPKIGEIVQIKHGGLEDWVTIEILSNPLPRPSSYVGYYIEVKYIDPPYWLTSSTIPRTNWDTNIGKQYNIQDAKFRPMPLTNEQILKTFLKKNKVLTKYRVNVKNYRKNTIIEFSDSNMNYALSEAFSWNGTEEGFEFWHKLSNKWSNLVKHFKLKGRIDVTKV